MKNSRYALIVILMMMSLFLDASIPSNSLAGTAHSIWGSLENSDTSTPANGVVSFSAYIQTRPGETITQASSSSYYQDGYWGLDLTDFPTGFANGDVLVVDFQNSVNYEIKQVQIVMISQVGSQREDVTLEMPTLLSIAITPADPDVTVPNTQQFTAMGSFEGVGSPIDITSTVTWNSSDTDKGTISATGLFTPVHTGSTDITASLSSVSSNTSTVTVTAGPLVTLTVSPDTDTLTADDTRQFTVAGADVNGNATNTGTITWSGGTGIGTIDSAGLFTATTVGEGTVTATSDIGDISDTSGTITVTAGVLATLTVSPDTDTLTADDIRQFTVSGVDADGNTADVGTIIWSGGTGIGTIDSTGLFTATTVGTGTVTAMSDIGGISDTSGTITVTAGVLETLTVIPNSPFLTTDDTQQFIASGVDADGNTADVGTITWSGGTGIGTIDSAGLFTATTVGEGTVTATSDIGGISDTSGTITVTAGVLATLTVSPDTDTLTADDIRQFTVSGVDADGNTADVGTITWSGGTGIGTIDSAGLFTATTVGEGTVTATSNIGSVSDTSGTITVTAGVLATLTVSPDTDTLTADDTRQFTVSGVDADGNAVDVGTITWSGGTGIGTIDSAGLFTATTVGEGTVTATSNIGSVSDTSGTITVSAGVLATLTVSPDTDTLTADDTQQFTVSGVDADGNTADVGTITWSGGTGIGTIDSAGLFTATTVGEGTVTATSNIGSVSDTSGTITVSAGVLATLTVSPDTDTLTADDTRQFAVSGVDADGNTADVGTITWSGGTGIGTINSAGLFDATTVGIGSVTATSNIGGIFDTTGAVTVTPGVATGIVLTSSRDTVPSGGKGTALLTATVRDADGNTKADYPSTVITFTVTGSDVTNAGWTSETDGTDNGVAEKIFTTQGVVAPPGTVTVNIQAAGGGLTSTSIALDIVNFSSTPEFSNLVTSGTPHATTITAVGAVNYDWSKIGDGDLVDNGDGTATFTAPATIASGTSSQTVITVKDHDNPDVEYPLTITTYLPVTVTAPTQAVGITHDGDITTYQITVTGGSGAYEYRVSNADGSVPMDLGPISVSETGLVTGQSVGTRSVYVWDSALGSPGTDDSFRAVTADIEVVNKIVVVPSSESVQSSGTQQYQASGGNGTYTWSVAPVSAGTITSAGLFTAAAVTVNMTDVIITATDVTYTNLMGTADLAVYSKVTITNKPEEPPLIAPGEESDAFTVAGGDDSAYTWSVAGPVDVDGGTGASFIFQAPDSGAFAGEYTVTVTDGQEFADSFTVLVPMVLDPDHYNLVEGSQLQIDILGAPEGSGFTFIAYDLNGNEVVFSEEGGDVTGWGQITREGNVLTYTPDDIGTADEIAFTLEVISDDADLIDLDLDLVESGTYRVIPTGTYAGVVKNADTDAPIGGALVTLMAPRPESVVGAGSEKVTMTDAYSRYTDVDGNFEFDLPATGAIYQFMVSMDSYVTKLFTSADLADSSDVLISATAATPLYISGEVSPLESGDIVTLTIDGEVVGVRITDFQGAFNFDFETDPGASEYLLTAVSKNAYNEKIVSGPLPIGDANIDLNEGAAGSIRLIVEDDISYERTDDIFGSDLLVKITAQDSTGNPITGPQFPNGLVLTLPFNLGQVAPGAFESGDVAVYHAAGQVELLDGDGIIVPVEDIIAVDYIGNGQTGYVTFRVYSLSVFGIGTGSGALSDSSDDSVCFISSVAGGSGMHLPAGVLGLAGLVAGLLHWTGKKSNR